MNLRSCAKIKDEPIKLDYICINCSVRKCNQEMDSMACFCGGTFRPDGALFGEQPIFEPYYDRVLGKYVTSYREQEKEAVNHRSKSHPDGLRLVQWDRKQINEYKNIHRHKRDYSKAYYQDPEKAERAKAGKTKYFISLIIGLLLVSNTALALEGVDYVKFDINGVVYDVPIPNKAVREDFRYLRMALDGDKIAREFLLGGKDEKLIFIGDVGVVRWVKLTQGKVEVIEYK